MEVRNFFNFLKLVLSILLIFVPLFLLLWIVIDLANFTMYALPYPSGGGNDYHFLNTSMFWNHYVSHCIYFEAKLHTRILWHFSWIFSALGVLILKKPLEKERFIELNVKKLVKNPIRTMQNTQVGVLLLRRIYIIFSAILLIIGGVIYGIKDNIHWIESEMLNLPSFLIELLVSNSFSIFPQIILFAWISLSSKDIVKKPKNWLLVILLITLFASYNFFANVWMCM